jgi:hypothetical protein
VGRFIIALTAVAGVCLLGAYTISPVWPSLAIPTTVFLSLTTLLIYRYLVTQKDPKFFVTFYLATMAFKILIFGAYVFVMAKFDKTTIMANVVYFMIVYFLTLVTEIGFLYYQKRQS